jgi:hypothetical protein
MRCSEIGTCDHVDDLSWSNVIGGLFVPGASLPTTQRVDEPVSIWTGIVCGGVLKVRDTYRHIDLPNVDVENEESRVLTLRDDLGGVTADQAVGVALDAAEGQAGAATRGAARDGRRGRDGREDGHAQLDRQHGEWDREGWVTDRPKNDL